VVAFRPNPPGAGIKASHPPRRILLVEDDVSVEEMLTTILEEQGYSVVIAHSPAEAIAALAAEIFDLIITDGFSRLPGDVLANAAGLLAAAGTTPVALFTGHRIERAAATTAGLSDLIAKPFDLETFEHQVRALLSPSTLWTGQDGRSAATATANSTSSGNDAR
jgi:DNA-binding response OmpR family regulator